MLILGVDPGSRVTGWGLVGGEATRPALIDSGTIPLPTNRPLAARLLVLQRSLTGLVERLRSETAAVETPFHGANARSALQLAHARGVILAVLAGAGLEVAEYAPARVKESVTGNGRATKEQVQAMVARLLGIDTPGPDRADALAVALCHATVRRYRAGVDRALARRG